MSFAGLTGIGSLIGAGTSLLSGLGQSSAIKGGVNAQSGILTNQQQQNTQSQASYANAGNGAINTLNNDLQNGTGFASPFTMSNFYNDPGYQFTLQQGQNAVNNSAAAKGGLLSGAAAKGLASYTSGLANQTYGDAYNRYLSTRQQGYNELAGVAGMGQQAIQGTNQLNSNLATTNANNTLSGTIAAANSKAAGIQGAGNSLVGGANNLGQYYALKQGGYL